MNAKDAKTVINILKTADHGCVVCVGNLFRMFKEKFPKVLSDEKIIEIATAEPDSFDSLTIEDLREEE